MRNPRIDPQKGDVLDHQEGELRAVIARRNDGVVEFGDPFRNVVSTCSVDEWRVWAARASILALLTLDNAEIVTLSSHELTARVRR